MTDLTKGQRFLNLLTSHNRTDSFLVNNTLIPEKLYINKSKYMLVKPRFKIKQKERKKRVSFALKSPYALNIYMHIYAYAYLFIIIL